ncbi:putative ABC transporter ATP-binding protein [Candidatus Aquiluna sp. IMCC13023]|uniref:ABC transporter ATP-binding protein n=1 Tax=Candidatus Aquiluna sp. IMCC13023 TaxID=1081644 RepID=UPI00025B28CF|nr:ABC transporter ATP-binding protein [Candidatus Aquiluna sp. IMCC13023]EIC92021.1 putative ABC transporter ATP-binding protein [Candidatus Aquiluna sp. IMCC13023]
MQQAELGTIKTLWRLVPFARRALWRIGLGILAAIGAHMVALSIPQFLQSLVNSLVDGGRAALLPAVGLILLLGVIEAALVLLRRWLVLTPGTFVEADMRNTLFAKLQDLPVAFHDRWPSGQLLSRAVADLGLIRRWLSFGIVLLIANFITLVVGLLILFTYNFWLGLIFSVASIPIWLIGFRFSRGFGTIARLAQDQSGDLATRVEESVHGVRVLKAFGRGGFAAEQFATQASELRNTEISKAKAVANIWLYLMMIPEFALGLALLAGIWFTANGEMTVGTLVAFVATAMVLRWPTESLGFLLGMTLEAKTATTRIFEVLDEPDLIADPVSGKTIKEPKGLLEFHEVHFHYPDADPKNRDLVDGVSLRIEPGQSVALIGLTGSGKTTLTALTTRLYEVTGGSITIDGVDIRDLTRADLRSNIAMAFEDATLFSSSVRDNVLLGNKDQSEDALKQALEIAQAQFVYDLPQGLDTPIGDEGLSLSGGQRQRLALARAVAAKPKILVLDDPLSAVDVDTEAMVEDALRHVLKSTTALIVAHRPSTVMLADKVALMQDGKIIAFGTHRELLDTSTEYRHVITSLDTDQKEREVNV